MELTQYTCQSGAQAIRFPLPLCGDLGLIAQIFDAQFGCRGLSDTFDPFNSSVLDRLRESLILRYLAWLGSGMRFAFREHEAAKAARSASSLLCEERASELASAVA